MNDQDSNWTSIKQTIQEILHDGSISYIESKFRRVYSLVYAECCINHSTEHTTKLYMEIRNLIVDHLETKVRPEVQQRLTQCAGVDADVFLTAVMNIESEYRSTIKAICLVLIYVQNYRLPQAGLSSFKILGFNLFREIVLGVRDVQLALRVAMLSLAHKVQSRGREPRHLVLRRACSLLVTLSDDQHDVYKEIFENDYLMMIKNFYEQESAQLLMNVRSIAKYMKAVKLRIEKELQRARANFPSSTQPLVGSVLAEQLIVRHLRTILESDRGGVLHLLRRGHGRKLRLVYSTLVRFAPEQAPPAVAECLRQCLREHSVQLLQVMGLEVRPPPTPTGTDQDVPTYDVVFHGFQGIGLLPTVVPMSILPPIYDAPDSFTLTAAVLQPRLSIQKHYKSFIESMLELREYADQVVNTFFRENRELFAQVVQSEMENLLAQVSRTPEQLALFVDHYLCQKQHTASEVKVQMEQVARILRLMSRAEREDFEHHYHLHMARRLLLRKSASAAWEHLAVDTFKKEQYDYFTRIQNMFRDVLLSERVMNELGSYLRKDKRTDMFGVHFSAFLLSSFAWPFSTRPGVNIPFPASEAFEEFRSMYVTSRDRRDLTLLPQFGGAELRAFFYKDEQATPSREFTLLVSTYQMCVLMMFNHKQELTFEEIQAASGIPPSELSRTLRELVSGSAKERVLRVTRRPAGSAQRQPPGPGHVFAVNDNFSARMYRVSVRLASEVSIEGPSYMAQRECATEEAVVREIRAAGRIHHCSLVHRVIECMLPTFMVHAWHVGSAVVHLARRGVIKRDPHDRSMYLYNGSIN